MKLPGKHNMLPGFCQLYQKFDRLAWPVAFALKELTAAEATKIGELVKKAVGTVH
jgi:hypothetical protein